MMRRDALMLGGLTAATVTLTMALIPLADTAHLRRTPSAEAALTSVITALALLGPVTLALLLRAAWCGAPRALQSIRALRGRVHDWRQWWGIDRVPESLWRPEQVTQRPGTMAVRPRHAAGGVR